MEVYHDRPWNPRHCERLQAWFHYIISIQKFVPFPLKFFSVEESLAIDIEIQRLLNIGAIEHSTNQKGEFI